MGSDRSYCLACLLMSCFREMDCVGAGSSRYWNLNYQGYSYFLFVEHTKEDSMLIVEFVGVLFLFSVVAVGEYFSDSREFASSANSAVCGVQFSTWGTILEPTAAGSSQDSCCE